MGWFRRCRCTRCAELKRELGEAKKMRDLNWADYLKANDELKKASQEAADNLAAWQKASDERDDLQRILNTIVELAERREA